MIASLMCVTGVVIMIAYLLVSEWKMGVRPSISDTYYGWQECKKGWIFSIVMLMTAFLCVPFFIDSSVAGTEFSAFLTFGSLGFVGAACSFKETLTRTVHYAGALVWGLGTVVWTIINIGLVELFIGMSLGLWLFISTIDADLDEFKSTVWRNRVLGVELMLLTALIFDVVILLTR